MTKSKTRIPLDPAWKAEQKRMMALAGAVAELDLDLRTVNGLEEVGVLYVRELVQLTRKELNAIPNFGDKSVERIIRVLDEHGLAIRRQAATVPTRQ
jgi:DNA-directed RNA polymerase alpha subunit